MANGKPKAGFKLKRKVDPEKHEETRRPECAGEWYVPDADVYETKEAFVLKLDVPGIGKDEVDVTLNADELIFTGHVHACAGSGETVLFDEYGIGHYHRHFFIPATVDRERINAELDAGVLTLTLPKRAETQPRRIDVA